MRAILCGGVLLLVLGVGVVHAHRSRDEGSFVAGWLQSRQRSPEPAPETRAPEVPDARPPPVTSVAATTSTGPSVLAAGELSLLESDDPEPMVRYFDSEGSIHMVRGLARVPVQHRTDAVVLGRGNVNVVSIPAPSTSAFRDWQPELNPSGAQVVLFSAPWCGACKRAKRHLDRLGVAYRERDIDIDAAAKQEVQRVLGRIAIPLLDVNGRYISGFSPETYDRALGTG